MRHHDNLRLLGPGGSTRAMEAELKRLAVRGLRDFKLQKLARSGDYALRHPFHAELARIVVHYARTPARVLWDLFSTSADRLEPMFDDVVEAVANDDRAWLFDGASISVSTKHAEHVRAGPLQIRGTIKNGIIEGARRRGLRIELDADSPDVPIDARGENGELVISVDLAGRSMHERGYRLEHGEAPLKEILAAQMIILSRWDPRSELLIDPMCGAGTIPIEAAAMAVGAPLWTKDRRPAIDRIFRGESPRDPLFPGTHPPIIANDVEGELVEVARRNARRAGQLKAIHFTCEDFRDLGSERIEATLAEGGASSAALSETGLIISNPPYGERMRDDDEDRDYFRSLYADLGIYCRRFPRGWRAAFLAANEDFERSFGGQPAMKKPMTNGNLPAWFLAYEL